MKGHHLTPPALAEEMARQLFEDNSPTEYQRVLYPGCGAKAPFASAVERICKEEGWPLPEGLAIENDPELFRQAESLGLGHVSFQALDFLGSEIEEIGEEVRFDHILGNPPYIPIEGLSEEEKARYRSHFRAAEGRFDLYLLFFERALTLLAPGGRLTFVTPEKWEYVQTARPLRDIATSGDFQVEEIHHVDEDAFPELITFPSVTTIRRNGEGDSLKRSAENGKRGGEAQASETTVRLRDGTVHRADLPTGGESWAAAIRGKDLSGMETGLTLGDVAVRVSPGMATGADAVFVFDREEVPDGLTPKWTYPTVSGEELTTGGATDPKSVFVCPYRKDGTLPPETDLGAFGEWASQHRERLEDRSCVRKHGKQWYAWHETPPMEDLLRQKIVFKDIAKEPKFWAEPTGEIVPRHTVYYVVPEAEVSLEKLLDYLNSPLAKEWMVANCQRAANGFLRLQSRVLKKLPVPPKVATEQQEALAL
jgi:hypothetical protein